MFYVYLLRSLKKTDKTYVGYTTNLKERFKKHNEGGSIYTKDDRPWELVAYIVLMMKVKQKQWKNT